MQAATVIAWRRKRFRDYWAALSRKEGPGRPPLPKEVQDLIKQLSSRNIGWGVPRIVGELGKLGIHIAKSTVEKYRVKHPKSPSPTWKSFLANHLRNLVAIDFFIVPTIDFRVLYVLVVLAHHRRELVYFMPIRFAPKATTHSGQGFARRLPVGVLGVNRIGMVYFNVTAHPTAQWVGQQMVEAFPWDTAPKYLLRDRDATYGEGFRRRVQSLLIKEVITAPRNPWQNAYVERVIGSIRRDCLDHIIVFDERHLNRILKNYFEYYHRWRTHLGLEMDTPQGREVQAPHQGKILEMPDLGGLHHHYGMTRRVRYKRKVHHSMDAY